MTSTIPRLDRYEGAVCEVRTMGNDLLLHGLVSSVLSEDADALVIVSRGGEYLPVLRFGTAIKVNLLSSKLGVMNLGAKVYIANEDFWRVNDLVLYNSSERRAYFRVGTNADAKVSLYDKDPSQRAILPQYDAQLINISLSGVLFVTEAEFEPNQTLFLSDFCIGIDPIPYSSTCVIRKMSEFAGQGNVYGCSFETLSERETDRLCQDIFFLERESIKKRLGRN